jgi:hypothetical protein
MSWEQTFLDPIISSHGEPLVTLRDAANYIVKLPKAEQQAPAAPRKAAGRIPVSTSGMKSSAS